MKCIVCNAELMGEGEVQHYSPSSRFCSPTHEEWFYEGRFEDHRIRKPGDVKGTFCWMVIPAECDCPLPSGSLTLVNTWVPDCRIYVSGSPFWHSIGHVLRSTDVLRPLKGDPYHSAVVRSGVVIGWTAAPFSKAAMDPAFQAL